LYISNRKEGFIINGSIHPRSKFLGTSAVSILEGEADVTLLAYDEQYTITFPSAYARGILFGTLLMELCGSVVITCPKSNLKTEIEFKAKPFWGGEYNSISGKIKNTTKGDTLYSISGKWDSTINITHSKSKQTSVLWEPKGARRLPRFVRPFDEQELNESQRLWIAVTEAIKKKDQKIATDEKTKLEEAQRAGVKQRAESGEAWVPKLFTTSDNGLTWQYRFMDTSPYDPSEGIEEEQNGIVYPVGKGLQFVIDTAAQPAGIVDEDDD